MLFCLGPPTLLGPFALPPKKSKREKEKKSKREKEKKKERKEASKQARKDGRKDGSKEARKKARKKARKQERKKNNERKRSAAVRHIRFLTLSENMSSYLPSFISPGSRGVWTSDLDFLKTTNFKFD